MVKYFSPFRKLGSPYLVNATAATKEQCYAFLPVCAVFLCVQTVAWLFSTCAQMLMHAIAHGSCVNTIAESTLKTDHGERKTLPPPVIKPMSVLHLAFGYDSLSCPAPV